MNRKEAPAAVTFVLFAAAAAACAYGAYSGEINIIFNKAINICMECIGIG